MIVCLSGSMRFFRQMLRCASEETLAGHIVLMPYSIAKTDSADKARLDELHLQKIDMADLLIVVTDESGYFGQSTTKEVMHAYETRTPFELRRYGWVPGVPTHSGELIRKPGYKYLDSPEFMVCLSHDKPEAAIRGQFYRCCGECYHVWPTREALAADMKALVGDDYREGEEEAFCPLCLHNF